MKKVLLPLCLLFAACQSGPNSAVIRHADPAGTSAAGPAVASTEGQSIDPICGMVKTDSWTNYSVYEGDTVWFCAAAEKKAFDAAPEKYARNIK